MFPPGMATLAASHRKNGEIIVVGEVEFFWAPILHSFKLPHPG
ncbi:MAG TPA: hypothetical protein VM735_13510 [Candidatus Kapabacteria bacterium]|nr:hypothetical protein [Candidatus Kapabacteria bacterium]